MSHHGSWYPSQTAHAGENAGIWLVSFVLYMLVGLDARTAAWLGAWTGFWAAALAEGKSIGNRMRIRDVSFLSAANRGDILDFAVHNFGSLLPVAVAELVLVVFP